MPFRPNYRQARGERDRAKQQKKQEKLRKRDEDAARSKIEELVRRGVRCELVIYEDEGHMVEKLGNRVDAFERATAFLDEVLEPVEMAPIR